MKTIQELCDLMRETSYSIHLYHGHGHLKKVYENALVNRLRKAGVEIQQQHPLTVPAIPDLPAFSLRSLRSFAANFHEGI